MAKARQTFSARELESFLDEALPPEEMARIEMVLRSQPRLARELAEVSARRDGGVHTMGEIWRRHRLSCPTREELGSFLLSVLGSDAMDYVTFHVETVGCRYCLANLQDLRRLQEESNEVTSTRRRRYFQSSAGYLRSK